MTSQDTATEASTSFLENNGMEDITRMSQVSDQEVHSAPQQEEGRSAPQPEEGKIDDELSIVDFSHVFEQILKLEEHSSEGCNGTKNFRIIGSWKNGFEKTYRVQCQKCKYNKNITCVRQNDAVMSLNDCAVAATMLTGGGYKQLEDVMSIMNVSCMSKKKYLKCQETIIDGFEKSAREEMKAAAEEEKALAIARNDIHPDSGLPMITVVADGSWMKRSYRGGDYSSLSGCGVIIGYVTQKVLHIAVKNKFCIICKSAAAKNEEAPEHRCYKNWDRTMSSTSMESAAIAEGFVRSVEEHGLIYSILVADGDSSVYSTIKDNNPYREQVIEVRKIECTNHLLRNFCKKIKDAAEKGQNKDLRSVLGQNIQRMRTAIKKAAEHRSAENVDLADQIANLRGDLRNVPSHVFGEHKECERIAYFCTKHSDTNQQNYVPAFRKAGIYASIELAMEPLLNHAESLIHGLNNNAAEGFNSIIAKFIGGKRINFGRKGSYQGRVAAAVVQYNTSEVASKLAIALGKQPTSSVENLEKRRKYAAGKKTEYKKKQKHPHGEINHAIKITARTHESRT